jgi:hypothetical protein
MKKIHDLRNLQESSRAVVTVTLDTHCHIWIEIEYHLDDWRAVGYKMVLTVTSFNAEFLSIS